MQLSDQERTAKNYSKNKILKCEFSWEAQMGKKMTPSLLHIQIASLPEKLFRQFLDCYFSVFVSVIGWVSFVCSGYV